MLRQSVTSVTHQSIRPQGRLLRIACIAAGVVSSLWLAAYPATAAPVLDQSTSFKDATSASALMSSQSLAQTFTPSMSGPLTKVGVGIRKMGSVTNLTIALYEASGGVPTGTSLATKTLTGADLSVVTTGQAIFDVTFSTPASVTSGSTYAIVATTTDSNSFSMFGPPGGDYAWYYSTDYAAGNAAVKSGGSWSTLAGDLTFATYVDAGSDAPTGESSSAPAPVYQQFGKPSAGSCDAAAPDTLNWAGVAKGGWSESWAEWMNGGKGGAVCNRVLIYSPRGMWVVG